MGLQIPSGVWYKARPAIKGRVNPFNVAHIPTRDSGCPSGLNRGVCGGLTR